MGWIGVDLDRTLAVYNSGEVLAFGPLYIGPPIPDGIAFVKKLLREGKDVRIFTARIAEPDNRLFLEIIAAIQSWCREHIGEELIVTNVKDWHCEMIYDDKATRMIPNTGRPCKSCMGEDNEKTE